MKRSHSGECSPQAGENIPGVAIRARRRWTTRPFSHRHPRPSSSQLLNQSRHLSHLATNPQARSGSRVLLKFDSLITWPRRWPGRRANDSQPGRLAGTTGREDSHGVRDRPSPLLVGAHVGPDGRGSPRHDACTRQRVATCDSRRRARRCRAKVPVSRGRAPEPWFLQRRRRRRCSPSCSSTASRTRFRRR